MVTYTLPELLGTKLRALYQRKKGRDLFDIALGLEHRECNQAQIIETLQAYMEFGGTPVTRAQFEANMAGKMSDATFLGDIAPLLRTGASFDPEGAWNRVHEALVTKLPGDPWQGEPE